MAGQVGGRSLEETPTWAVAVVCFVLVAISIIIEHIIHLLGKWLSKRNRKALFEALEKIKSELMMLGFLSLLLTVGQNLISKICVSEKLGSSWHPCDKQQEKLKYGKYYGDYDDDIRKNFVYGEHRRRLLREYNEYMDSGSIQRRALAGGGKDECSAKGQVPLISPDGIHQLHIFIFVLAVFHVICCLITLALGRLKMRKWKAWEMETKTPEYQYEHDPERFRFARDTSFGRRHMNCWSQFPFLLWVVCFFRQFVRSVPKVDYLTLRHGFINAHMAPHSQTNFNFQNYIRRTLEQDFKVVVAISPPIWFFAVLFLLFNTNGWKSYLWLPFIPLIIILLVGTKLQVIITKMGLRIQERGEVVKGAPVVQPADDLFWFNRPRLLLYLIQFVFFQNAFQLAFFTWAWLQFGMRSCFHQRTEDVVIRLSMGVLVQILCSYVTLPLYALVTQMGSKMKPTIFNERIAKALRSWHQTARKQIKKNRHQGTGTPVSSMPSTPRLISPPPDMLLSSEVDNVKTFQRSLSPPRASLHSEVDRVKSFPRGISPTSSSLPSEVGSVNAFPRNSTYVTEQVQAQQDNDDSQFQHRTYKHIEEENEMQENSSHVDFQSGHIQLEINVADFSFEKNI